jgi:transcriptional regulator with XRE-family HTH domain
MGRTKRRNAALTDLGLRAKTRRSEMGISQIELSHRIGLHWTFVSEVERGQRNLALSSLLRLAEGLEMDPGDLVEGLVWE